MLKLATAMKSSRRTSSGSRKDLPRHRPPLSTASESPQPIVPQGNPISRKEIIRRCSKSEEDSVTKYNGSLRNRWRRPPEIQQNSDLSQNSSLRRPTTLPSVRKKLSNRETSNYRKVSRQEIIRRRSDDLQEPYQRRKSYVSDADIHDNTKTFVKNVSGFSRSKILARSRERFDDSKSVCDFGSPRSNEVGTLVPRPSTLPKITHLNKNSRNNEEQSLGRSNKELGKKEAPIYGRIRRRKASLTNVSRDQDVARKASGRFNVDTKKQVSSSRDSISTSEISFQRKTYRSIRDPVNDPVYRPRSLLDMEEVERKEGVIYGRVASSRDFQGQEDRRERVSADNERRNPDDVCNVHRTMSRRRIIRNVEDVREFKTLGKLKPRNFLEPENEDEIHAHTLPGTSHDLERIKRRRSLMSGNKKCKNPPQIGSVSKGNTNKSFPSRGNSLKVEKSGNSDRFRWSRSIIDSFEGPSSLLSFSGNDEQAVSRTLPSYMKKSKNSYTPARIDSRTREISQSSATLKLTKERTNQERKSVSSHAKTFSDANSVRSNSPGMSSSIFAFCTGKRKVGSRIPSKVKDNFYRGHTLKLVRSKIFLSILTENVTIK